MATFDQIAEVRNLLRLCREQSLRLERERNEARAGTTWIDYEAVLKSLPEVGE